MATDSKSLIQRADIRTMKKDMQKLKKTTSPKKSSLDEKVVANRIGTPTSTIIEEPTPPPAPRPLKEQKPEEVPVVMKRTQAAPPPPPVQPSTPPPPATPKP